MATIRPRSRSSFTAPVVRDSVRFRAACMANLVKANKILTAQKRGADAP